MDARQSQRAYLQVQAAVQRCNAASRRWGLWRCAPVDTGARIRFQFPIRGIDCHWSVDGLRQAFHVALPGRGTTHHPVAPTDVRSHHYRAWDGYDHASPRGGRGSSHTPMMEQYGACQPRNNLRTNPISTTIDGPDAVRTVPAITRTIEVQLLESLGSQRKA